MSFSKFHVPLRTLFGVSSSSIFAQVWKYEKNKPHGVLIIAIIVFIMGQIIPWDDSKSHNIHHMGQNINGA